MTVEEFLKALFAKFVEERVWQSLKLTAHLRVEVHERDSTLQEVSPADAYTSTPSSRPRLVREGEVEHVRDDEDRLGRGQVGSLLV
jgi:hypothetical protein